MITIDEIVREKLPLAVMGSGSQWTLWEKKSLNVHRGVLYWKSEASGPTISDISELVRNKVKESFKISWWRGFAFGVVLEFPSMPEGLESISDSIDIRTNRRGIWQWTILSVVDEKKTVGVHTWIKGYLTPVYQNLVDHYQSLGHEVGSFKKEKGKIMEWLTTISNLGSVSGTRRLTEFDPRE